MTTFKDVEKTYRKWLYLDHDPDILRIVFGIVVANRYKGPAVWGMLVGPSGGGKTALVSGLKGAYECNVISSMTAASFGSGNTGTSFLDDVNESVLVMTDFSTISSLPREQKGAVFSILREVYDGEYQRRTGKSAEPIVWKGKVGMLACATSKGAEKDIVDGQELGERMLVIRLRVTQESLANIVDAAYDSGSKLETQVEELEEVTSEFLDNFQEDESIEPSNVVAARIKMISRAASVGRSGVIRDRYTQHITFPVDEMMEAPGRLVKQFKMLATGLQAIGSDDETVMRILRRIGQDCLPIKRLKVLRGLSNGSTTQASLARSLNVSPQVAMRTVEELKLLGIVDRGRRGGLQIVNPAILDVFGG